MTRYRYDKDMDCLVEIRDGSNFFEEDKQKGPTVISDIKGYQAIGADVALNGGRPYIGSRSEHRAYLRRNGYVETGNDTPKVYDDRPNDRQRQADMINDIRRANGDFGSNTGADAARYFAERNKG